MVKIRTIIAEDEHYLRQELANKLMLHAEIELISECSNGIEAVDKISKLNPDLVFLDIKMPGLNGFEVINNLQSDVMPEIVFATAFDEYAIKAFDVQAIDYLVKPYSDIRLNQTIENFIRRKSNNKNKETLIEVGSELSHYKITSPTFNQTNSWCSELTIDSKHPAVIIKTSDIAWVDAAGDYMCIHANNATYIMRCTMNKLTEMLDPSIFLRIHRSTIININHVKRMTSLQKGDYLIDLNEVTQVKLSRSYSNSRHYISEYLQQYSEPNFSYM